MHKDRQKCTIGNLHVLQFLPLLNIWLHNLEFNVWCYCLSWCYCLTIAVSVFNQDCSNCDPKLWENRNCPHLILGLISFLAGWRIVFILVKASNGKYHVSPVCRHQLNFHGYFHCHYIFKCLLIISVYYFDFLVSMSFVDILHLLCLHFCKKVRY